MKIEEGVLFKILMLLCFPWKTLGIAWKPSKHCQHPSHASIIQKKAPPARSVPLAALKKLNSKTDYVFDRKDSTMECSQNGATDSILVEPIDQNACMKKMIMNQMKYH